MRQLHLPSGGVVGSVIIDTVLECLEHHAIGSFDLAVTPWVGDQGIVDVSEVILAESQKTERVKVVPRSVMILLGTPKRCLMSLMNLTASFDVTFVTGQTSIHLVNLSTATWMCL
jgi:hypothetical protein